MAGVPINDGNDVRAPRYLDLREGKIVSGVSVPYDSQAEVLNAIPFSRRCEGLPVKIKTAGKVEWWQFKADRTTLEKTFDGGGGGVSGIKDILQVSGSEFKNATDYENSNIQTAPVVFLNSVPRFLIYPTEYDLLPGGGGIRLKGGLTKNDTDYFFIYVK